MNDNKFLKNNIPLHLNEYQCRIFNGLKQIGQEISTFYLDGVKIFQSNIDSKPYLLAHIAREIEGGIRDIWTSGKKIKTKKCSHCGVPFLKKTSHIDEICGILEVDKNNKFAKEWHKIASEFHKYAHRHGAWRTPREKIIFDKLWKRFEMILLKLVGGYLDLLKLVDKFLSHDQPTKEMLNTLNKMLQNGARNRYFFTKLKSRGWFFPLKEKGYFSPKKVPESERTADGGYIISEWNVLPYLEKVSEQISQIKDKSEKRRYIKGMLEIIKNVTEYHKKNNNLDNYHIWYSFI